MPRPQYDGGRAAYSMLLGLSVLLLVAVLSFYQLSSPPVAKQLIAEGVAALTEIDVMLEESQPALEQAAESAESGALLEVPGFPLEVRLTREEVLESDEAEIRDLILRRAATLVYENGLDAFDQGGASVSFFSAEGLLDWLINRLSETNHQRSGIIAAALGILVALAAVMVVVRSRGFARLRSLGVPLLIAAIAGWIGSRLIVAPLLGRWWGGDPFGDTVHDIVYDAVGIGSRNYTILGILGLVLIAAGIAFELAARFGLRDTGEPQLSDDHF